MSTKGRVFRLLPLAGEVRTAAMRTFLLVGLLVTAPALGDYALPGTLVTTKTAGSVMVKGANFPIDAYVPTTGGPWPVIGLGHGFSNSKDNMAALAQLLASRGNVVVVPQFPVGSGDHARNGEAILAAIDWAIGNTAFAGKVDATRQAVAGHSAGGLAAFLAGAARPSLRAVVLLDAVDNNGLGLAQVGSVKAPVLLTFAEGGMCNSTTNSTAWWAGLSGPKARLKVVGAGHCDAQDPPNSLFCTFTCGAVTPARQTLFKRYAVAWLQYFVSCELAARDAVDGAQVSTDTASGALSEVQQMAIPVACSVLDGGVPDAGLADAGLADAGFSDAGVSDAGVSDAGISDAGISDAGKADAGVSDAGSSDAGKADAGVSDAGSSDAGFSDAGVGGVPAPRGCGCSTGSFGPAILLSLLGIRRRRVSR